jgi:hypothetical protein
MPSSVRSGRRTSITGTVPRALALASTAPELALQLSGSGEPEPARDGAFLVLLSFLVSFLLIRSNTRLIRSRRFSWWPGNLETESGLHIHHRVWGISLLLLSGFITFATELEAPWWQLTAIGFGIGAGLPGRRRTDAMATGEAAAGG